MAIHVVTRRSWLVRLVCWWARHGLWPTHGWQFTLGHWGFTINGSFYSIESQSLWRTRPSPFRLRREIHDGGIPSRGYGVAWSCWDQATHVCYPIPLNVALRGLREVWFWVKVGRFQGRQSLTQEIEILRAQLRTERSRIPSSGLALFRDGLLESTFDSYDLRQRIIGIRSSDESKLKFR